MTTTIDAEYVQTFGPVQEVHPDFKPVATPWGTCYLHKDGYVWIQHYPLAKVQRHWGKDKPVEQGCWHAYFANEKDIAVPCKPWCQSNWRLTSEFGVATKEEAVKFALDHVSEIQSRQ